ILLCPICGKPISDIARWGQIKLGNWINQKPTLDTAGFHLSELLSPWSTIKKMVQDYLIAKRGGPEFLKTFTNTVLGETSSEDIDIQPTSVFLSRREPFDENTIPTSVNFLVATVDVQDSRLEFCLIGYGLDQETYIIKHLVINGNPFDPKTFDILETQIDKIYSGKQIYVTLIDSGGHATNEVYTFANRMTKKGKRVYAIKGVSGDRPLWPRRSNRSRKYNTQFYPVGVDLAKSIIWDRLKNDVIGPRYIHFSHTLDPVFFEQLQNEIPVYKQIRGGYKKVWELKRKGNEAWDLLVYGVIALYSAITAYERSCFSIDVPEIKVGKSKYLESMREN
ncbi:MAG: phage terminase large subunit family protein, partial [Nanoarchaeota archaeon]|nr:phage terminase large subunit family protein [Nanoarchaeota archaeon]